MRLGRRCVFLCGALWAATANAQSADCGAVEGFFEKLGTVMFVTKMCPAIKPDLNRMKAEAASLGVDLPNLDSYKDCPGSIRRGMSKGRTAAAVFGDAGPFYPCASVVATSGQMPWGDFFLK